MLHFALMYLQIFEVDMKLGRTDVEGEGERQLFTEVSVSLKQTEMLCRSIVIRIVQECPYFMF